MKEKINPIKDVTLFLLDNNANLSRKRILKYGAQAFLFLSISSSLLMKDVVSAKDHASDPASSAHASCEDVSDHADVAHKSCTEDGWGHQSSHCNGPTDYAHANEIHANRTGETLNGYHKHDTDSIHANAGHVSSW